MGNSRPLFLLACVVACFSYMMLIQMTHQDDEDLICAAVVTDHHPTDTWPLVFEVRVTSGRFRAGDDILIEGVEATIEERWTPNGDTGTEIWRLTGGDTICPFPSEPIPDWTRASITLDTED